eukprot:CAMPEP_0172501736 /NCGR_PEP_ID=MMETSP1066-20121228/152957_1 /TAXON_ID=671091 /ORGANISM="Coscinodiscus wailesii, Strain CCMP2513" /LENGTH=179 /DNA_ID=CAMNT_0013276697 /DNA_START=38 /DNA_END=577 /DNA_ORIENTATION=+
MGNKSSSAAKDVQMQSSLNEKVSEESGIYVGQELQNKMVHDFQSNILNEEWHERQKNILTRGLERALQDEQRRHQFEKKWDEWKEKDKKRQFHLDSEIDSARNQFADLTVALEHDVKKLKGQFGTGGPQFGKGSGCLDARVNLVNCMKEKNGPFACDPFMDNLERCVKRTILKDEVLQQ